MQKPSDLKEKIKANLSPEIVSFINRAAEIAGEHGEPLFLVGGAVRDLLLGQPGYDIDLTVEGDAMRLARELTESRTRVVLFPQFGTAKIQLASGVCIDIARARKEIYSRPGALPTVSSGSLADDLLRRDFTVNAMAVSLETGNYGNLIDLYGGFPDLERKLIRVLHDKSFTDDATRIWRAVRYAARLGFDIEPHTLELVLQGLTYLDTISGDRIRYELECIFNEDCPEKAIEVAGKLGVLTKLNPELKSDGLLAARFRRARDLYRREKVPFAISLALLTYPLDGEQIDQLIAYLRPDRTTARVLRDTIELRGKSTLLSEPKLTCADLYHLLKRYNPLAIRAIYVESNDATVCQHVDFYLYTLKNVKPLLSGKDIQKLGVPEGPKIKEILELLLDARLNGRVSTREDEETLVKNILKTSSN